MPAPRVIITTSAALSSAAEMIEQHIEEAPDAGTMDALMAVADALSLCSVDHGGSTDAPIRLTLTTVLR